MSTYIVNYVLHPRHPRLNSLKLCTFRTCDAYTQAYTQATPKFSRKFIRQWPLDENYSMTNFTQWPLHKNYSMTNSAQWPFHGIMKVEVISYFLLFGCRHGCRLGVGKKSPYISISQEDKSRVSRVSHMFYAIYM